MVYVWLRTTCQTGCSGAAWPACEALTGKFPSGCDRATRSSPLPAGTRRPLHNCRTPLLHLRDTYPVETAWAPQYVGDELRQVRDAAWDARLTGLRAATDAQDARRRGDHLQANREQERARSYHALEGGYRQREIVFAAVMADRTEWDAATRRQRQLAVAADAELRRRHPGRYFGPLRSAEPGPATSTQRAELTMTAGGDSGDRPVDQGSGRRAPDLRRSARGPAEREDPVRGPRLRRSRPGVPCLVRAAKRSDLAAS